MKGHRLVNKLEFCVGPECGWVLNYTSWQSIMALLHSLQSRGEQRARTTASRHYTSVPPMTGPISHCHCPPPAPSNNVSQWRPPHDVSIRGSNTREDRS
ncbi:hypothetical protein B296_00005439 [Ensete ventricosum]|uniref:Uncharacterized protein n=1 Tax=Ensete ventricosum TaxID=4639 RepID=A0A427A878_ENSVE|nr:hypothetical protein B296_00005439 [Ensete ventricosum]